MSPARDAGAKHVYLWLHNTRTPGGSDPRARRENGAGKVADLYPSGYTNGMNLVARLRRSTGLTQAALAELAGTSQPTIAAYETGTKRPSLRTLQRLASAVGLGVHVSFVPHLTREDRRSLALHERIADRLRAAPAETLGRAEANLLRMRGLHPGASDLLDEWNACCKAPRTHS